MGEAAAATMKRGMRTPRWSRGAPSSEGIRHIVYFGPKAPASPSTSLGAGKGSNWIQTIPGKSWNTVFRLSGPLEPWFDNTWRPGEIKLVK